MLSTVKWEAFYINTADPKLSGKTDLVPADISGCPRRIRHIVLQA